jgi:hypothetical protein
MSEVKIIVRAVQKEGGSPYVFVDCIPNLEEIPHGEVKALVKSMLDAAGVTSWKQTLDIRKDKKPSAPTLRLVQ